MKINRLIARNLKNRPFLKLEDLGEVNYVHGANGAGKTAILQAIIAGTIGESVRGKKPAMIMEMAGREETLEIILETTAGQLRRAWQRTEKGAKTIKTPEFEPPFAPICINASQFLAMNGKEQVELITGRFGNGGNPREMIEAAVNKVAPKHAPIKADSLESFLSAYEDCLKGQKSNAAAIAKTMAKTLQGMTAVATSRPVADREQTEATRRAIATIEAELKSYDESVVKAQQNVARYNGIVSSAAPDAEAIKTLSEMVAQLRAEKQQAANSASARFALESQKLKLEQNLQMFATRNLEQPSSETLALFDDEDTARGQWEELRREMAEIEEALEGVLTARFLLEEGKFKGLERGGVEYKGTAAQATKALMEAFLIEKDKAAQAKKEVAERLEKVESWLDGSKAIVELQIVEKSREELLEITEGLAALKEFTDEQEQALKNASASLEELKIQQAAFEAANGAERAKAKAEEDLLTLRNRAAEIEKKREALEAEKAKLLKLIVAETELAEWEGKQATYAQAEEEAKKAEEEASKWDGALKAFIAESSAQAEKLMLPLLERARRFTAGCLPSELSNSGTRIGRFDGVHFVPLEEFSGSEQALTVAALAAALAKPGEGLVMVDEFNVCLPDKKEQFLRNLIEAVKNKELEQAFIFDNVAPPCKLEGLTVIAL